MADLAPGSGVRSLEGRAVLTTGDGEEQTIPLRIPGELGLELPGERSTVRLAADGFWSRSVVLDAGELRLRLHPATRIEGKVTVPGGSKPPEALRVQLDGPALRSSTELSCPVDREKRFACDGPAGVFDLQVRSHGFAPHFLWDVELMARRATSLGALTLEPGASLSGFVLRTDGNPAGREATVSLRPQVVQEPGSRDPAQGKPLTTLERRVQPGERGFFVFADVAPGRYDLEATEPDRTPARLDGIEILEGSETHLVRPLELSDPVAFEVQLWPALAPSGNRWRLRLIAQRILRTREGLIQTCDEQGFAEFPALPEDTYMLVAEDPVNGHPFEKRVVEVAAPLTFVEWELPLVAVVGRVRLGREPLPAKLTFGPTGMASRSFEANEDGRFSGVLPRAGEWEVMVDSREHGVSRWLRGVEVPEPSEPGEEVRVTLDLPATEIGGTVVDEEYRPTRGQVIVQPLEDRDRGTSVLTDRDGRFTVRGLPPGAVELFATVPDVGVSPVTAVQLPPDSEIGPIQLRVERQRTIEGSIRSPQGPVRGARISLRGAGSALHLSSSASTTTDARGAFTLEMPAGLSEAHLQVRAPGHPLTVRRVRLEKTLHLTLQPIWGAAEVDWDQELVARLWMVKDGASWTFNQFVSWAMSHPGEGEALPGHTRVPRLEPGVWHLCAPVTGSTEWLQMVAIGLAGQSCRKIEVTAWGTGSGTLQTDSIPRKE